MTGREPSWTDVERPPGHAGQSLLVGNPRSDNPEMEFDTVVASSPVEMCTERSREAVKNGGDGSGGLEESRT